MADDDNETPDAELPPEPVTPQPERGADDAALVALVLAGNRNAFGQLYDRWFDRVLDLAYRILWDTDAAADAAQEAFLSAWRNLGRLEDHNAFGGWLLRIARNAALDRQRRDRRVRPADEEQLAMIEHGQGRPEDLIGTVDDPETIAVNASFVELLWDAAEALGERDREVLDLSLRHGMEPAEIAEVVGLNRNAANQLVHRVRQRLATAVGARMLWRSGTPECAASRAELVEADVEVFDDEAVRVIERHSASCNECSERKTTRLSPERMFAAIPIMVLPSLKAKVAHALARQGAPMHGSEAMSWSAGAAHGDKPPRKPWDRRKWLLAAAIVGGIILIGGIIAAFANGDDDKGVVIVPPSTTSTTRKRVTTTTRSSTTTSSSSTTTSSSSTTTSSTTTPTTTQPTTAPPPPTTLPPIIVTFTLTNDTVDENYPLSGTGAPKLTWSVTNVSRVHVYDAVGAFDSTKKSGSATPCPDKNNPPGSVCEAAPGKYVYTLDAYNSANQLVLHRTQTLTINSA